MKRSHSLRRALSALLLLVSTLALAPAQAEQKVDYGDYEIHYIAVPTTLLEPEIAKAYGLERSKSTGMLNVSVLKKQPDGSTRAVGAFVRGKLTNDVQQERELEFTRVAEGEAIYSIAPFWYSQGQPYTFQLEVQADPEKGAFPVRFSQTLYPD
ncbi:MAG: DUF4426 domain-containing protein [Hahellaceae bacterium]|nr:DUF4426 domain-containing protein [Hahellaceae bacterium]